MKDIDGSKMIEIYSGTPWQAGMVKTLLEDAGIQAYMADEIIGTLNPWWTAPGGAGAIRIMISGKDEAQAKIIIETYEKNINT